MTKVDFVFIFCPPLNKFKKNYFGMIRRDRGLRGLSVTKDMAVFRFVHAFELFISESPPIILRKRGAGAGLKGKD
jgi:hypothetical protein